MFVGADDPWYDGVDQGCAGDDDMDADAYGHQSAEHSGDDCDDYNADISPEATEEWYDGIDQDCDGNDGDQDSDGIALTYDCDDENPEIYPNAAEIPDNGVDEDCDGADAASGGGDSGEPKTTPTACGCSANPEAGGAFVWGLLGPSLLRRRKTRRAL